MGKTDHEDHRKFFPFAVIDTTDGDKSLIFVSFMGTSKLLLCLQEVLDCLVLPGFFLQLLHFLHGLVNHTSRNIGRLVYLSQLLGSLQKIDGLCRWKSFLIHGSDDTDKIIQIFAGRIVGSFIVNFDSFQERQAICLSETGNGAGKLR